MPQEILSPDQAIPLPPQTNLERILSQVEVQGEAETHSLQRHNHRLDFGRGAHGGLGSTVAAITHEF